jgi:putative transposase
MRQNKYTLKASSVYKRVCGLLVEQLGLVPYKRSVSQTLLAALLLLAAFTHSSVNAAVQLHPDAPCYQSVRSALHANLPPSQRELLARLRKALVASLPVELLGRAQPMALDLHQRPFWGKKGTKGTTNRKRKDGTGTCFAYATLATVGPEGRFTVGLLPTYPSMRLDTIICGLLAQAKEAGLKIAYLMMDKEFDSAEVYACLGQQGVAFIVPMQKRGEKEGSGNHHLFEEATAPGWYDHRYEARLRRWVFNKKEKPRRVMRGKMAMCLRACVARGNWNVKQQRETRFVYACFGLVGWSAAEVRRAYRKRFGIETTYRQLGQCLGRTSSTNERWRLLLVGVGLLLLNVWAALHLQAMSSGPLGERNLPLGKLRLLVLLVSLLLVILAEGPVDRDWQTQRHVPQFFCDYHSP